MVASSAQATEQSDSTTEKKSKLPTIGLGYGLIYMMGDVGYTHYNEPLTHKSGWLLDVQLYSERKISLSGWLLSGVVNGEEKSLSRNLNFRTTFLSEGITARYDFVSDARSRQSLIPYLSAGVGYMVYKPKADLKDASGRNYYYWNDGSIKSTAETDPNAAGAIILHRDYKYETDLRDANFDTLLRYKTKTFVIPVSAGVKMKLSSRVNILFGSTLYITMSDQLDDVNKDGSAVREGNKKNDNMLLTSATFRYNFAAGRDTPKPRRYRSSDFKDIDFVALEKEDSDGDGIPDFRDESSNTEENTKVDTKGNALDTDGDGIPDFRDKEPNTKQGVLVTSDGVELTDEMIAEKARRDSLAGDSPALKEYLKTIDKLRPLDEKVQRAKGIPKEFQKIDTDKNGQISPKEISAAIDSFLDGKSGFSTAKFYQLIDFYFRQ